MPTNGFGAQIADIEVDPETGKSQFCDTTFRMPEKQFTPAMSKDNYKVVPFKELVGPQ